MRGMFFFTVPAETISEFIPIYEFSNDVINMDNIKTKTCTLCGKTKPLEEFTKHRGTKDGHSYWCKECNSKRNKMFRESPSGIYTNILGREKFFQRKIVTISRENFIKWYENEPKICAYCDIPEEDFFLLKEKYGSRTDRLTIDCKDNDAGYIAGNLVIACERCNFIKSNLFSYNEMREIGQKYIKPKWQALKRGELTGSIYLKSTKV